MASCPIPRIMPLTILRRASSHCQHPGRALLAPGEVLLNRLSTQTTAFSPAGTAPLRFRARAVPDWATVLMPGSAGRRLSDRAREV